MEWSLSNLAIPSAIAAAAIGVLYFALRGRHIDDHPLCRRCGFDLWSAATVGSNLCPECGTNVASASHAVLGIEPAAVVWH